MVLDFLTYAATSFQASGRMMISCGVGVLVLKRSDWSHCRGDAPATKYLVSNKPLWLQPAERQALADRSGLPYVLGRGGKTVETLLDGAEHIARHEAEIRVQE